MSKLTSDNFQKGFLVDDELMAGVTEDAGPTAGAAGTPGTYSAFVLNHTSGEYLGYKTFPTLEAALQTINQIPRPWLYERTSGCGNEDCGKSGGCKGSSCKRFPSLKPGSTDPVPDSCG